MILLLRIIALSDRSRRPFLARSVLAPFSPPPASNHDEDCNGDDDDSYKDCDDDTSHNKTVRITEINRFDRFDKELCCFSSSELKPFCSQIQIQTCNANQCNKSMWTPLCTVETGEPFWSRHMVSQHLQITHLPHFLFITTNSIAICLWQA